MNRSIILFSPFFYPEPISTGKYNTYLVKALQHQGCGIEVVALHPSYPDWKPKRTEKRIEGANIWRGGGLFPYAKSQVLRRLELEVRFLFHALWCSLRNRRGGIVVPVFPPILFFPFINLFLPATTKRIGIVHDVLGVMAGIADSGARRMVTRLIRLVEKKVFQRCDKLIFLSRGMANRAVNDYALDPARVAVCYPFVTIRANGAGNALGHLFASGHKHIVYSGALGEKQNPYLLLRLFETMVQGRKDIICHFFSRGPIFDDLKKKKHADLDRVLFHDLVPEENLYELYKRSDVQIVPQAQGVGDGAIPSKLPNIIKAGTSVFSICEPDTDLAEIIRLSGIGHCAFSWDIEALASELDRFIEASGGISHQVRQQRVDDFVRINFGIERLVKELINCP